MAGRNNKPDNDGPAGHPSRLDQFGDKMADGNNPPKKSEGCGCGPEGR
ncbi:hypothetical protein GCM10023310_48390 [Paenibacillus vulneris]|uniref:Uncharacterized protein n=1 Tax=Paenibacillus vulneris TaxID=1133364 RepID=A0ABW3UFV2_9BACL